MSEQITWTEALGRANGAHGLLVDAHKAAVIILTEPGDRGPVERYAAAFTQQYASVEYACREMAALCRAMVPNSYSKPAPRPLETVLADIEAEGHGCVEMEKRGDYWHIRTHQAEPAWRQGAPGETLTRWYEWQATVEDGRSTAATAVEAAEARLAQIRALHAERVARSEEALAIRITEMAQHQHDTTAHAQAVGETDIGDTRPLLVDPLDTIADAFAARRTDDDRIRSDEERGEA